MQDVSVIKGFSDGDTAARGSIFLPLWRWQWALKNFHLEFTSTVAKMTTGENPAIASTADSLLPKLWTRTSPGSRLTNFAKIGQASPSKFLLQKKKICQTSWAWRLEMDAPATQRDLEWLSRWPTVSVTSLDLEAVALHLRFTQVIVILLRSLRGRDRYSLTVFLVIRYKNENSQKRCKVYEGWRTSKFRSWRV